MLSTFTVTTVADNGSNTSPTTGSLRAAIVAANALTAGTYSTIDFDITGTGVHEIEPAAPLPAISNPVNINGLYETGSSATDPLIRIDGTDAGALASGLEFQQSASGTAATPTEVSGLEITDFGAGAVFSAASYVELTDLFVGVTENAAGLPVDAGNGTYGVDFASGSHDTLSGSVVSANKGSGVVLADTSDDTLSGDFIGTDVTAKRLVDANGNTLGNAGIGVYIYSGAASNTVTSTVVGNNEQGVVLGDATKDDTLAGDWIGTNATSSIALPNGVGVVIEGGATANTIGGTTAAARDLISGNGGDGVDICYLEVTTDTTDSVVPLPAGTLPVATGNVVEGDYIGVTYTGTAALGNGASGVAIFGNATHNTVGGTVSGAGNVISGNVQDGVYISEAATNLVAGNDIGTNSSNSTTLGNYQGVVLQNDASGNTVGGTTADARNVISGNNQDGVHIVSGAFDNTVEGNYIGTNVGGTAALGNGQSGAAIFDGATNNTIGGTVSGAGNVLSGNDQNGVYISDSTTTCNLVEGNDIGTNSGSSTTLGNSQGVLIQNDASCNTIGGTIAAGAM